MTLRHICSFEQIVLLNETNSKPQYKTANTEVHVDESIIRYIAELVRGTREHENAIVGSSPRGGVALLDSGKAMALIHGRDFVVPDDIKEVAIDALSHRVILHTEVILDGVKEETDVHEDMFLEPLTDYSRYKAECEKILLEYESDDFTTTIIRPATVCGYSPRQRLDVVVNILTNLAFHNRKITVFGGSQLRPNIHIADMISCYTTMLFADEKKISGQIYNVGYENQSVQEIAETVRSIIGDDVELIKTPTDDNRSYHISSEKIKTDLGFEARCDIKDAVAELRHAFQMGKLPNSLTDEKYYNIKRMQALRLT